MPTITLTSDQQAALEAISIFLMDPQQPVFVLEGYSGVGKSTLVKHIVDIYPTLIKSAQLIDPSVKPLELVLTATTNKAAEALTHVTGEPAVTIHSFLGLRVARDYKNNTSYLQPRTKEKQYNKLIFIDEASYIDSELLKYILQLTVDCKILLIGDPAQLLTVKSSEAVAFNAPFPRAKLTQVVRQGEGNPIIDLSTKFRNTVNSGEFFSFIPDGISIQHMDRETFDNELIKEFARKDWKFLDSKVLAWTNKRVIEYNHALNDYIKGTPSFQVGDYAINNNFIGAKGTSIKTDQLVRITHISDAYSQYGITGKKYTVDGGASYFMPDCISKKNAFISKARSEDHLSAVREAEEEWIDLRAAYACTVNKAQGSTYDQVFIDLDDISKCNNGNTIARMLYVAVSRARHRVVFTGDF